MPEDWGVAESPPALGLMKIRLAPGLHQSSAPHLPSTLCYLRLRWSEVDVSQIRPRTDQREYIAESRREVKQ